MADIKISNVDAIGKPTIRDHLSAPVSYTP